MSYLLRRIRREDGAILIIAIVIITVVALVTGFVLTRGETSLRATVALRSVAGTAYQADGAAQMAINALRTGYWSDAPSKPSDWTYVNDDGEGCFGKDSAGDPEDTLTLAPNFYPKTGRQSSAMTAAVVCTPEDDTGAQGPLVPINTDNKPGNAILTLGTGGEDGISGQSNGQPFRVHGGVVSHSNITMTSHNSLLVTGSDVLARTGCTGPVEAPDGVKDCNRTNLPDDPNYASDADPDNVGTGVPALAPPPTGTCPGGGNEAVITFHPGYYDDVTKLNAYTNVDACKRSTYHFEKGTYYFDFHNEGGPSTHDPAIFPSTSNKWIIGFGSLVAGTPAPGVLAKAADAGLEAADFPGTCINPIHDVAAEGVQFIFGGNSRMQIGVGGGPTAAKVEICGTYHVDRPPVAVYGLKNGVATATTLTGGDALTASGVPSPGLFEGADVAALEADGGTEATWNKTTSGSTSTTMTVNGFAPPTAPIPKGSVLTGATLQVRHQEQSASTTVSKITIDPDGPAAALPALSMPAVRPTMHTDSLNLSTSLSAAAWGNLKKAVHDQGFSGASMAYQATLNGANTMAKVDAIRLELTFVAPQWRGQTSAGLGGSSNCVGQAGGCNFLETPTTWSSGAFYIQGTTYVPKGRLSLYLNNVNAQVLRFGLISRSLYVFETSSVTYDGPVIEIPDDSPGFGTKSSIVQLKVHLCPGPGPCVPASGDLALTARVQLWDPTGNPEPNNREIRVLNWSHPR